MKLIRLTTIILLTAGLLACKNSLLVKRKHRDGFHWSGASRKQDHDVHLQKKIKRVRTISNCNEAIEQKSSISCNATLSVATSNGKQKKMNFSKPKEHTTSFGFEKENHSLTHKRPAHLQQKNKLKKRLVLQGEESQEQGFSISFFLLKTLLLVFSLVAGAFALFGIYALSELFFLCFLF